MKSFFGLIGFLILAALSPATGWSHGVTGDIVRTDGYLVTAAYDDGEPMNYAAVNIKAPEGEFAFQSGRTDRNGHFMFSPDQPGQWQIEVKDGMGHRLALDVEVSSDAAVPKDTSPQKPVPSVGLSRTAKVVFGLSIIFGVFGVLYGWKARHALQRRPATEGSGQK